MRGGGERKAGREVESHLVTEHRQRAGAGAIVLLHAVGKHAFHQVEILAHGSDPQAAKTAESEGGVYRAPACGGNVRNDL